jgi:two-component system, NarL family, nitrate/nitrite response regulator NarL
MPRTASTVSGVNVRGNAREHLNALISSLDEFAHGADDPSERVLMDQDIDGRRYLVVRLAPAARNPCCLSPRELEIVRLIAAGHPNKVIAGVLDISAWTVSTHVRRVFGKLCVTSRAAMVARMAEFARQPGQALRASPISAPRGLAEAKIDSSSFERHVERLDQQNYRSAKSDYPTVRRNEAPPRGALKRSFSSEPMETERSPRQNAFR